MNEFLLYSENAATASCAAKKRRKNKAHESSPRADNATPGMSEPVDNKVWLTTKYKQKIENFKTGEKELLQVT